MMRLFTKDDLKCTLCAVDKYKHIPMGDGRMWDWTRALNVSMRASISIDHQCFAVANFGIFLFIFRKRKHMLWCWILSFLRNFEWLNWFFDENWNKDAADFSKLIFNLTEFNTETQKKLCRKHWFKRQLTWELTCSLTIFMFVVFWTCQINQTCQSFDEYFMIVLV